MKRSSEQTGMGTTDGRYLELVSHIRCPYVQRAVIALEEMGVPYGACGRSP